MTSLLDLKRGAHWRFVREHGWVGSPEFLTSPAWRILRQAAFTRYGRMCLCCGRSAPKVILNVDHVKPRIGYPWLAFDLRNLQILCRTCNAMKGNLYEWDFRNMEDYQLTLIRAYMRWYWSWASE